MTKVITIILLLFLITSTLSGCNRNNKEVILELPIEDIVENPDDTDAAVSTDGIEDISENTDNTVISLPIIDNLLDNAELNAEEKEVLYKEYFSEEREWIDERESNSEITIGIDPEDNKLYKYNIKDNYSKSLFLNKYISAGMRINGGVVYADSSNQIYFTDDDDIRTELIYTGSSTITSLWANSELIYFVEGSLLYRLHIQSGFLDIIVNHDSILYITPFTNHKIRWAVTSDRKSITDETMYEIDNYITNTFTSEIVERYDINAAITDMYVWENTRGNIGTDYPNPVVINGVTLPLKNYFPQHFNPPPEYSTYTTGTYFNTGGYNPNIGMSPEEIVDTPGSIACNHSNGVNNCKYTPTNPSGSGKQCNGFARYVYGKLYDSNWNHHGCRKHDSSLGDAAFIKANVPIRPLSR